ncbi:Acylglycerol kinase, mitochondrial [Gryllus bimaculatus]|nr:Acylglycerol kinase, mitochondrial [Gryllus bimaculatus]
MAKLVSFVKTIRNNWKKSIFGCVVVTYGLNYAKGKYDCHVLMADYCREALEYGNISSSGGSKIRNVTVFVNPAANKRKAKKNFDAYCAPLLHLAGLSVTVVLTKSQGEARTLAEHLDESVDAVIVAGGDGTLAETVTGLLRRETGRSPLSKRIPVGILPLGQINASANFLFSDSGKDIVKKMGEATMSIIQEVRKPVDVIRIEQLEKEREDQRPVYGVNGLRWGAVHDTYAKRDKYWYWGALREYMAFIFMGFKKDGKGVTWNCNADILYSLPCNGCSECYMSHEPTKRKTPTRWWQSFVPKQQSSDAQKIDYSKIKNEACSTLHELSISAVDMTLETSKAQDDGGDDLKAPYLKVSVGPSSISYLDFVNRGWQFIKGDGAGNVNTFYVKDVKLQPTIENNLEGAEYWYYIDNDDYEVKPIYIKLLPKRLIMFCQRQVAKSVQPNVI